MASLNKARTLCWLEDHRFYQRTGVARDHVRFCLTRPGKRPICEELHLTHFVDDHPEVHDAIRCADTCQYFFGPQETAVPSWGIHAETWADAEQLITSSLAEPASIPAEG